MNEDALLPGEDQDELDAVEIRDNGEPLVDFLGLSPRLTLAPQHPVFEFPRVHVVRESVARMLVQAAESLPEGLELHVVEGYRPIQVQRAMWAHALEEARKRLGDASQGIIEREAGRYSAPPDAITPPPHTTGGAVDVAIVRENGEQLDFFSPFELSDMTHARADAVGLSDEAQKNRALLRSVLEPTGLTQYVDEWWHWSYGDNGWALRTNAPHAIYDKIELPANAHWIGDMDKMPQ
ncbi:MAG TPA: M15 family metallopeptidase [Abditibacteriaceae bacterium]|jgi:D-alanyl-D-alanine dipeptidase